MHCPGPVTQVNGVCAELEYALKRLVKGLASNRKRARHGFYTALTQVMVLQWKNVGLNAIAVGWAGHNELLVVFLFSSFYS